MRKVLWYGVEGDERLIFVGPIALKWNSDETLPMNCDVSLTTDILIYDSCGKKVIGGMEVAT